MFQKIEWLEFYIGINNFRMCFFFFLFTSTLLRFVTNIYYFISTHKSLQKIHLFLVGVWNHEADCCDIDDIRHTATLGGTHAHLNSMEDEGPYDMQHMQKISMEMLFKVIILM